MPRKSRKHLEATPGNTPIVVAQAPKPISYAAAYIRLSVVDKRKKGDSIETQQAIINAFIAKQDDIELRDIYIDNGHSGQSFDRPDFKRMLADMESGKINCCITKDLSRLGRNAIDSGYYIEKFFPSIGVRYIAISDDYDSADGQCGGIMVSLKNMINEAYALDASRKIKATVRMNIRKGKFVGSSAPYGYFKSKGDCHKLVIDENTAPVIKHIFEMAAAGQRHQTILAWLNNNRVLPPRRYMNSIGLASDIETGALTEWWSLRSVRDTLRNRVYCGVMIQGRSQITGGIQIKLPESDWAVTENAHEVIVSRELFEAVQRAWPRAKPPKEPYFKTSGTVNIFAKKLYCAQCGHAIIRKRVSEKGYRYLCNVGMMYTKDACGGFKSTETNLKVAVFNMLLQYKPFLEESLASPTQSNTGAACSPADNLQSELKSALYELDRNSHFLKGLYESLLQDDISADEYKDMKGDYEAKITALSAKAKHLSESIQILAKQEKELSQANDSVQGIEKVSDLTAGLIDSLVEKIRVYQDGRLEVKFRFLDYVVYSHDETGAEGGAAYE